MTVRLFSNIFWILSNLLGNLQILSDIKRDGRIIYSNEY